MRKLSAVCPVDAGAPARRDTLISSCAWFSSPWKPLHGSRLSPWSADPNCTCTCVWSRVAALVARGHSCRVSPPSRFSPTARAARSPSVSPAARHECSAPAAPCVQSPALRKKEAGRFLPSIDPLAAAASLKCHLATC